jgi:hypothetical protein
VVRWDQRHVNLNKTNPFQVDGYPINQWAENSNNRMFVRGQFKPMIDGAAFTKHEDV